jgi:outer membrane lipoprotein SlyB
MTLDAYRSIGAITGLVVGLGLMFAFGFGGMIPGFLFGAVGAVAGGMSGEKIYATRK